MGVFRRYVILGTAIAAISTLAACSWANFKGIVYSSLQANACNEQRRNSPPVQQGTGAAIDCFQRNDPRAMTPAEYNAERRHILGQEDSSSQATPESTAASTNADDLPRQ